MRYHVLVDGRLECDGLGAMSVSVHVLMSLGGVSRSLMVLVCAPIEVCDAIEVVALPLKAGAWSAVSLWWLLDALKSLLAV